MSKTESVNELTESMETDAECKMDLPIDSNEEKKDIKPENQVELQPSIIESVEEEDEDKEEIDEEENALGLAGTNYTATGKKSFLGHTCTLKTLLDDQVLSAEDGSLSFDFMGKLFTGDLMPNGNIRWQETKQTFTTPSGWVNHCKKAMTSDTINKTVSAWSVIKYRGKRLDSYKLRWYRMKKKSMAEQSSNSMATQNAIASSFNSSNLGNLNNGLSGTFSNGLNSASLNAANMILDKNVKSNTELLNSINPDLAALYNEATKSQLACDEDPLVLKRHNVIEHSELPKKYVFNESEIRYLSCNQLVRAVPFRSLDRIQPFTISVSTNALLLMDYHCHLTNSEVVGYLAGSWDIGNHMLNIVQAFPCKVKANDERQAKIVEEQVREQLRQRNLCLVGWYHNHVDKPAYPSVKDIECQLEYQVTMKGNECDLAYIPCVGFICSPYFEHNQNGLSSFLAYWIMPPFELSSLEYGKPMQMFYQISRDCFLTQDLLLEMRLLAHFYMNEENCISFKEKIAIRYTDQLDFEAIEAEDVKPEIKKDEPEQVETEKDTEHADANDNKTCESVPTQEIKQEPGDMKVEPGFKDSESMKENMLFNVKNESNCKLKSISFWNKLKLSLQPNLPKDLQIAEGMNQQQIQLQQQALSHYWAFLKGLLLNSNSENNSSIEKSAE